MYLPLAFLTLSCPSPHFGCRIQASQHIPRSLFSFVQVLSAISRLARTVHDFPHRWFHLRRPGKPMQWPWKTGQTLFPQSFEVTGPLVGATAVTAMPLGLIFSQVLVQLPPNMAGGSEERSRFLSLVESCTCITAISPPFVLSDVSIAADVAFNSFYLLCSM